MRAGYLKYPIELIGFVRTQSESGFVQEEEQVLYRCRASIRKQMQSYDKDGLMAKEQFFGQTIVFQVRDDKRMKNAKKVRYSEEMYAIVMVQPNGDGTKLITCKKIDE